MPASVSDSAPGHDPLQSRFRQQLTIRRTLPNSHRLSLDCVTSMFTTFSCQQPYHRMAKLHWECSLRLEYTISVHLWTSAGSSVTRTTNIASQRHRWFASIVVTRYSLQQTRKYRNTHVINFRSILLNSPKYHAESYKILCRFSLHIAQCGMHLEKKFNTVTIAAVQPNSMKKLEWWAV